MFRFHFSALIGLFLGLGLFSPLNAQETDTGTETGLEESVSPPVPFQIVGFGDSLMAGYRLENDQSFTAQLEKAMHDKGYNVAITNAGVSGDTTTGGRERVDWSVQDGTGLVILELGANDMLRAITPELTEENLDYMLNRLKERHIPVLLAGMLSAPNLGPENADKFNPIYPRLAEKYQIAFYPFFLDGVASHTELQLDDGMHPNEKGVAVMVEKFMPTLIKELDRLGVKPLPLDTE